MNNGLHNDDCFEVLPSIKSQSIDAIITDMPFGLVAADWDVAVPLDRLWPELERVIKPNGAIVHCSVQPFTTELILSNRPWYRYSWYWLRSRKTNFPNANCQPLRIVEEIVVFSPSGCAPSAQPRCVYNPQKTPRERAITRPNGRKQSILTHSAFGNASDGKCCYTDRHPTNFLDRIPADKGSEPCQKPLALVEYLVTAIAS